MMRPRAASYQLLKGRLASSANGFQTGISMEMASGTESSTRDILRKRKHRVSDTSAKATVVASGEENVGGESSKRDWTSTSRELIAYILFAWRAAAGGDESCRVTLTAQGHSNVPLGTLRDTGDTRMSLGHSNGVP
eukprot:scaffold28167_cov82-Skeletonema_marinoi.AAC.1